MSLKELHSLPVGPEDVTVEPDESIPIDIVVEDDEDLAGAIERWFEEGEEFDRRYSRTEGYAA
jgi:hypothetical protein